MPKKVRPPVEFDIKWTEDETNPGGKEPNKKLMLEQARYIDRTMARRDLAEGKTTMHDGEDFGRRYAAACDELLNSVIVKASNMPRSDKK